MIAENPMLPGKGPLLGELATWSDPVGRMRTNGDCVGGASILRNPKKAAAVQRISRCPVLLDVVEPNGKAKRSGEGRAREEHPTESAEFLQSATHQAFNHKQDNLDMMRLVSGCDEAMESLMQRHAKRLLSQLMRILRNHAEAQECLLEAFVRAYQHRHAFHLDAKFSTWLYVIAFNLARDRLRWLARRPEFVSLESSDEAEAGDFAEILLDPALQPDQAIENREYSLALAEAVATLPEVLRQPLVLSAEEDKSQPEIAAQMHCTVKAVEMRLYHARKCLNDVLAKEFR